MGWYWGNESAEDYELGKFVHIRKDGNLVAFFRTDQAKTVNLTGDNPGVYVAFPLYSDASKVQRLLE